MPELGDRVAVTCAETPLMLIGRDPGPDGSYGRTAQGGALPRDPNDASLWLPGQGRANSCGTTTLAYILRYLIAQAAPTRAEIDQALRRGNIFSAPLLLVNFVRQLGLSVQVYNGASFELLQSLVERCTPVMELTDTTPLNLEDTANLHWVAVVAIEGDNVAIYNPHGFQEQLDRASFESHWREARLFGLPAWRNLAIAIGRPADPLPRSQPGDLSFVGASWASNGLARIVNNSVSLRESVRSSSSLLGRLSAVVSLPLVVLAGLQTTIGGLLLLLGGAARWLRPRLLERHTLRERHTTES
jgi:hypothetical protein